MKLVNDSQLDNDLTSVANAIRQKGNITDNLAFPSGFVSAIENISGGKVFEEGELTLTETTEKITVNFTKFASTPSFFYIIKKEIIYNQNGVVCASVVRLPFNVAASSSGAMFENVVYAILESRTTYANYANPFCNSSSIANLVIDNTKIVCPVRNRSYPFFSGEYQWLAIE